MPLFRLIKFQFGIALGDSLMRGIFTATVPLALFALIGSGETCQAQPSVDAIIDALKPTSNSASRGTRESKLESASTLQTTPTTNPSTQGVAPSVNLKVNFPTGSAELTVEARTSLDALGKALTSSELAHCRFRIEGHTDNVGSRDENLLLSQKRAEAVVSYLTSQYNVDPALLEAVGIGQEQPLVETPPQTPEGRNRRVQVINLGG